tara:strand:- start:199 stop:948 length:750 start_codon:yes stop_codon:yes gene_type:complete
MLFSIITVVFNSKKELERTVHSIQNQSCKNFEHIIIDAASTDGTAKYIESLSFKNIKYLSEEDNGIYDGMNKGIDLSNGDYMLFLNAADTFANDSVLERVAQSIEYSQPKIIYGGANIYSENGKFLTSLKSLEFSKINLNKHGTRVVCHQSIFVHRSINKKYSEKYKLKGELDWYYYLSKNVDKKNVTVVDYMICNYFLGGTGDKNFWSDLIERIKVTKAHNKTAEFFLILPYLIMPIVFRVKRAILNR